MCSCSSSSCCSKEDQLWIGLVAFVIGAVILLQRFDVVPLETWDYLWPSILVVSGLKWMVSCGKSAISCPSCGMEACVCEPGVCEMPMEMPKKSGKKKGKKK